MRGCLDCADMRLAALVRSDKRPFSLGSTERDKFCLRRMRLKFRELVVAALPCFGFKHREPLA
jgi:hypothetical protein